MTLRDYRLTAAARTWGRAHLTAADAERRAWLLRRTARILARAKHAPHAPVTRSSTTPEHDHHDPGNHDTTGD